MFLWILCYWIGEKPECFHREVKFQHCRVHHKMGAVFEANL